MASAPQMGTRSAYLTTRVLPPPTWRPFSAVMACMCALMQPSFSISEQVHAGCQRPKSCSTTYRLGWAVQR